MPYSLAGSSDAGAEADDTISVDSGGELAGGWTAGFFFFFCLDLGNFVFEKGLGFPFQRGEGLPLKHF